MINLTFIKLSGKLTKHLTIHNLSCINLNLSILSSNGITAGGSYATETIRSAIKKVYGAKAKLDCSSGALTDVTINFYVQGKSTYQITDVLQAGSCKGTISIPSKY